MDIAIVLPVAIISSLSTTHQNLMYQQLKKVCALLISPEKSQQLDGNGCSNTDSLTHTGKKLPAILKKPDQDLSSKLNTEAPWPFPSGGCLENQQNTSESGTCGETATNTVTSLGQDEVQQQFWSKTLFPPTKSEK